MSDERPGWHGYRARHGLFVGVRSSPSTMRRLLPRFGMDFERYPEKSVASFRLQPDRPTAPKRALLDRGVVGVIRSPLRHSVLSEAFANLLAIGLPVLDEPHAATRRSEAAA